MFYKASTTLPQCPTFIQITRFNKQSIFHNQGCRSYLGFKNSLLCSLRASIYVMINFISKYYSLKRVLYKNEENVTSYINFILTLSRSSFMFNKIFTIAILHFKNSNFGLSSNFWLKL